VTYEATVKLALQISPRIKAAETDVMKARAGLAVAHDMYIPSAVIGGGLGDAFGITLTVPTIFTMSAQSLVFSMQQRSYVKAAHADLDAAEYALQDARQSVEQDAAVTYLSLNSAQAAAAALEEQYNFATRLAGIMQDRFQAHLESELEVLKYRRGELQIKLAKLDAENKAEDLRLHLATICGISAMDLKIVPETIPAIPSPDSATIHSSLNAELPSLLAAKASEQARELRARGDAQYTWRPQIGFGATYGRISPIENVSEFYNLHGNYNTASAGVSIQFPIFDRVRHAAAEQSMLDAKRAQMDLDSLRANHAAERHEIDRSFAVLNTKAELADVNYEIANNQMLSTEVESQHNSGGQLVTPKDVENAHIEERQRFVEMLDSKLQVQIAQINLLRVTGQLDAWMRSLPTVK
jgi:outer membrane protein TolC